jgi:hypothetical protein
MTDVINMDEPHPGTLRLLACRGSNHAAGGSGAARNPERSQELAIEPSPCGLSAATRRYIGSAPNSVIRTNVATGESAPAASAAMPG